MNSCAAAISAEVYLNYTDEQIISLIGSQSSATVCVLSYMDDLFCDK